MEDFVARGKLFWKLEMRSLTGNPISDLLSVPKTKELFETYYINTI